MVPVSYHEFFLASVGAAGAFVGLLFVAISIAPERTIQENAPVERRALAANAFSALLNAFFISIIALLPGTKLGPAAATLGAVGEVASLSLGIELLRRRTTWRRLVFRTGLLVVGVVLYGYELADGLSLMQTPAATRYVAAIATLLLGLYALGIARAWQLLGGRSSVFQGSIFRPVIGPENEQHENDSKDTDRSRQISEDGQ